MAHDHSNETKLDKHDSSEENATKVSMENVTAEPQAQPYEPKFKTFSGGSDQVLPSARYTNACSEFVIEDKQWSGPDSGQRRPPNKSRRPTCTKVSQLCDGLFWVDQLYNRSQSNWCA